MRDDRCLDESMGSKDKRKDEKQMVSRHLRLQIRLPQVPGLVVDEKK